MTISERIKHFMESDFLPESKPEAQYRVANALDYIAYHIGQIDKKLEKTIIELEKIVIEVRSPPRG